MKFQLSYNKSQKMMLLVLPSIFQQIWKIQQWPQDWKKSVFIPTPKKGNARECSDYHTIELISHARKVMLKILQARLQQYMNWKLKYVQAGFRKDRGIRDQIANILWMREKSREFQNNNNKNLLHWLLESLCVNHNKLENYWRDGNSGPPHLSFKRPIWRSRSNN